MLRSTHQNKAKIYYIINILDPWACVVVPTLSLAKLKIMITALLLRGQGKWQVNIEALSSNPQQPCKNLGVTSGMSVTGYEGWKQDDWDLLIASLTPGSVSNH